MLHQDYDNLKQGFKSVQMYIKKGMIPNLLKKLSRVIVLFILLLFPLQLLADTLSIATFNIRIFSNNSRDESELYQICNLLKEFDFIAIQEVRDTVILDRTVLMLKNQFNLDYKYLASPKTGRKVKEIYAFLYRTDKVEYLEESYTVSDEQDLFIREPFFAKFKAGNFDFYVISIHIIWGDSIAERRAEALLLDDVYLSVQNMNDENDILLMGDFNLGPDDKGFLELLDISDIMYVNEKIPTSIKDRLYDNIFFQSNYTSEFTGKYGVMKFDEQQFDNDDKKASLMVSDHRPLWAEFDVGSDDDD